METTHAAPTIQQVPVDRIDPSPFQARRQFYEAQLKSLAQSISDQGQITPILVRPVGDRYELIAGERRWRAAQLIGKLTLEARVEAINDQQAAVRGLVENLQRENLNPIEEAQGFVKLQDLDKKAWTHEAIAKSVGKGRSYITESLGLLSLPSDVQKNVCQQTFSRTHAVTLLRLTTPEQQIQMAHQIIQNDWSVKETEKQVNQLIGKTETPEKTTPHSNGNKEQGIDPLADVWETARAGDTAGWDMNFTNHVWTLKLYGPEERFRMFLKDTFLKLADALGDVDPERKAEQALVDKSKAGFTPTGAIRPQVFEAMKLHQKTLPPEQAKQYQVMIDHMTTLQPDFNDSEAEQIRVAKELAAKLGRIA